MSSSETQTISFHVGGVKQTVNPDDLTPETTLNTYLREKMFLTGTKRMCLEGGCGVCVVAVEAQHPKDGKKRLYAVNSCLVSIYSCHSWKIHTIEGIGDAIKGFDKVQETLAFNNGSQCGFCSPGMVMNMYALQQSGPVTKEQVENSFGSNICRCTGYRPILKAFKSLASDAKNIMDIEDLAACKATFLSKCEKSRAPLRYKLNDNSKWIKPYKFSDLLQVLGEVGNNTYQLVAGNTARGVYWITSPPNIYIDVTSVTELISYKHESNELVIGGNFTLTATMELFLRISKSDNNNFWYLEKMQQHIDLVAHVPVRNIGTIAGNLMIKYLHNEFPSDIFLILETVKSTLVIVDTDENEIRCTPLEFLKLDMNKKVIKEVILPGYSKDKYVYGSYKIMIRAQNTHALVNAGYFFKMDNNGNVHSARICYGAINPKFVHASHTEQLVVNKNIFDNKVLQNIYKSLDNEIKPDYNLPDPTPKFRKELAIALFYKFVLSIAPEGKVDPKYRSGGTLIPRALSTGDQTYGTDKKKWPLSQPIVKVEALAQTTGMAQYIADMPNHPYQLHASFVTAETMAGSVITNIDSKAALQMPGVVAFYSKDDIPGENSFAPKNMGMQTKEEIFCSGKVKYYYQPIGIVVADTLEIARAAAKLVKVTYAPPLTKPYLNIKDVLDRGAKERIKQQDSFVRKRKGTDVKHVIKGTHRVGQQYHFHMEVQCCNVIPTEDGLNIYPSTQWMDLAQNAAAAALNINTQKINVFVRRLGGAYGAKISRNTLISTAACIAAYKLKRPVKMWLHFQDNMNIIGKRMPFYMEYEVGVDDNGKLQYLDSELYTDYGCGGNELIDFFILNIFQNCYDSSTFQFDINKVSTDTYANTYARAPGSLEGFGAIETIMDHISRAIGKDPLEVRLANLDKIKFYKMEKFIKDLTKSADVDNRKKNIQDYNEKNRWKKRGISVTPMAWMMDIVTNYTVYVSVFHADGGVAIFHGGIEMGQGINTKVVQVCAYKFGISIDKVQVKPAYNAVTPNDNTTGGSLTSETVVYALLKACDKILARMKPIRDKMNNPTWEELVKKCFQANVQLCATGVYTESDHNPGLKEYIIYGVCATEVEVDILTGQHQILKVDILEDVGDSMSPLIDMGQLEGAFIMGLGFYITEEMIFNDEGKLLTNRTWTYKPPGAKDIPIEMNVSFPLNNPNPVGVLMSKAIAEPPACLSVSIPLAIRNALASAREEANNQQPKWYPMDGPSTVENTLLNTLNNYEQYVL